MRKELVLPLPTKGNGKTFKHKNDTKKPSHISNAGLFALGTIAVAGTIAFILKIIDDKITREDKEDNDASENKVFDIITENNRNKMAMVSKVSAEIKIERLKRKQAEKRIIELEKMIEKEIS